MVKNNKKYWVGFDLGGTKMLATVLDANYEKLASEKKKTRGSEGAEAGMARIIETIGKALSAAEISAKDLAGIGIACPGPLDLNKGVILEAPNLGWKDVAIEKQLEAHFGCPAEIANDVDAGVFGEYRFGAGKGARCVLGVFPGTGIGGGCVYEGKLLRGKRNSCLEIGHMPVKERGSLCGCGRAGCLETVASRLAIAAEAAKAAYRGEAPHLMEEAGTDLSKIRSGVLSRSIEAGDEVVEKIVRHAARTLGKSIGGVVNLLAPDVIVLGGGLVEAMPKLYVEEVEKGASKTAMPSFADQYEVKAAKLGDDAAVMGAAAWAAALHKDD